LLGCPFLRGILYPFRWMDILSALDSLWWLGFRREGSDIGHGLDWLAACQVANGLWKAFYRSSSDKDIDYWTTLRVCRVLKRYLG